uniref:Regulator n=1 Tax=Syphacia muris TaxID=451379 RepID=A0A0N5AQJ4_9BILA
MSKKDPFRRAIIFEGRGYATKAYALNGESFEALRWTAVLTGAATEFLGVRERVREGKVFTDHLNKAIAIEPKEFTLLHLRGRFCFEVANLSWLEKKVANALFSGVPNCTTNDALTDFLEAEKCAPFPWAENLLFIARCYAIEKQKELAAKYIKKIESIGTLDPSVVESLREVKSLISKK